MVSAPQERASIIASLRASLLLLTLSCLISIGQAMADQAAEHSAAKSNRDHAGLMYVTRPNNVDARATLYVWERVSAAYKSLNIEAIPVEVPLARMYLMVDQGSADAALAGLAEQIEPRYNNLLRVPAPVFASRYHIYGFDRQAPIESWADLGDHTVAAIRGFDTIKRHLPQRQIIWVNSAAQLLGLLAQKRVHYVVGLEKQMATELARAANPDWKQVRRLNREPLHEVVLYHYLAPRHASLKDALANAISIEISNAPYDDETLLDHKTRTMD